MSRLIRIAVIAGLWLVLLGGMLFWFAGRESTTVSIAAGPASGESFELAMAIARVVEAEHPDISVEVYETQGSGENIRLLSAGRVDMAAIQADSEIRGDERAIAVLYADAFQLVAATAADIHSVPDLAGHRVAIPPAGSGQNSSFWFLLDHFSMSADVLTALPMSDEAANFAMQQGQVDAVFRVRAPGNTLVRELVRDQEDMQLISITQAAAMALRNPTLHEGVIPEGSYRGHPALPIDNTDTAVVDRVLVARKGLNDGLVNEITRLLFERRASLVSQSNLAGLIRPVKEDGSIPIPLHEGARRYYDREKPSLVQENSRLLATLLYIGALFTSLVVALRTRVKQAHRVRVSDYNGELMAVVDKARDTTVRTELLALRERLVEILQRVVRDLDADKVTREEFDHFSFTWQAVDRIVRDYLNTPREVDKRVGA